MRHDNILDQVDRRVQPRLMAISEVKYLQGKSKRYANVELPKNDSRSPTDKCTLPNVVLKPTLGAVKASALDKNEEKVLQKKFN